MLTRRQLLMGGIAAIAVTTASRTWASVAPVAGVVPARPPSPFDAILGESRAIRALRDAAHDVLERVSGQRNPTPLLIAGETGSGKELLARATHLASPRATAPFVACCVVAIPEVIMAPELFGYAAGAFDGAGRGQPGLFQAASGGTLLLNEARCLRSSVRRRVVKALQRGGVRRIGGTRLEPADVWVVATTASCDPNPRVDDGRRWRDLFAPLAPLRLTTPPLRERGDDVLLLAEHFLAHHSATFGMPSRTFSEDARRALLAYVWPGNVRELSNVMERVLVLSASDRIEAEHVQPGWTPSAPFSIPTTSRRWWRSRARASSA